MKLLWLCNMIPSAVQETLNGRKGGGLWVDQVLSGLRQQGMTVRVLCLGQEKREGRLDEKCSYATFTEGAPYVYMPELEQWFRKELQTFQPDVIHVWGVEFGHSLAMVNAAEALGMLDHLAVSIQGLCSFIARHYNEGIPYAVQRSYTFRDFLRQDNLLQQQRKFARRGELECQALRKARHVIGRTHWDEACTKQINPELTYHFCNETLRDAFYQGHWQYENCRKHRIFASSCAYPVKGFHYLLEAFAEVVRAYPDATLAVPGKSFLTAGGIRNRLRESSYKRYLARLTRQYGLEDRIEFLGSLSAEEMKQAYLEANVFVMPSSVENSPNSLGEAMLLGVPCIASDVGGVTTLMHQPEEGFVYQSTAPYVLAHRIKELFAMEDRAAQLGNAARLRVGKTHDPGKNLQDLIEIYRKLR